MIKVENVEKLYYQCESCTKSGEDGKTHVRKIVLEIEGSGQGRYFKLCGECFKDLQDKFWY